MEFLIIVLGIGLVLALIVLHEYGHFLVAKRNGVEVEEFGLGLPPRLGGKVLGRGIFKSYYSLNLLPIGGFVKLKGETDDAQGSGTYGSKSLYVKAKILLAGIAVNFLIAVVLFTFLALIGIPKLLPAGNEFQEEQFSIAGDTHIVDQRFFIGSIEDDSPAHLADLKSGDQILSLSLDNQVVPLEEAETVLSEFKASSEANLEIQIQRNDQIYDKSIKLPVTESQAIGFETRDITIYKNTWSAPISGLVLSLQYTKVTLQSLFKIVGNLITGDFQTASESVGGPVSIFFFLKSSAKFGLNLVLMLVALISLTLAIMNALPIPALDGGRLALTVLFRKILKKPLTKQIEAKIVNTSMLFLLALIFLITVVDINRYIL